MMPEETIKRVRELQVELNRILEQETPRPKPPSTHWNMFTISIQFNQGGRVYDYLLLRVGNRWFTTGTGDSGAFESWYSFIEWLHANAYWHGSMYPLVTEDARSAVMKPRAAL